MAIGNLRSKSPLLKPPIINAHAHSNTRVHQITNYKPPTKFLWDNCQNKVPPSAMTLWSNDPKATLKAAEMR